MRAAVVRNPRAHANSKGKLGSARADVPVAEPMSPQALAGDLRRFAADGVELLVIDGGDGTVREVLTALPAAYGDKPPLLAVLASGKTNILAFDLGVRRSWTLQAALAAAARPSPTIRTRAPLRLERTDADPIIGFVFGAAGFVRATAMAGGLHRARVFHNASVALALGGAAARSQGWSEPASLTVDGGEPCAGNRLVFMATTLQRLPFAMRPFGPPEPGLKYLDVGAPARGLAAALPLMLWSGFDGWLAARGYRRGIARRLDLALESDVIVDGETYPGGDLTITEGPPLRFLVP